MKLGLNSEAAALSGLFDMVCELGTRDTPGRCHGGKAEVLFSPKRNGFANGFSEAGLRPAERGGAISGGRVG